MCKFNERVMILAMKEKNINTKLAHTGDIELSKKLANSVSVPKVLPIYMSSVFSFEMSQYALLYLGYIHYSTVKK